jgi:protein-L-isoaspartate(D-aspartate) O-methyltransferase
LEEIVGPAGLVVSLDIDQDIADTAAANLRRAGRGTRVRVLASDGGFGWPSETPYDRVIVTAGAWDIAPAWFDQLVIGGRLILPLEFRDIHKLVTFERTRDQLVSLDVRDSRFVQLRGAFATPVRQVPLTGDGLYLSAVRDHLDAEGLAALIAAGPTGAEVPLSPTLTPTELHSAFRLWLALHTDDFCMLSVESDALRRDTVRAWTMTAAHAVTAPDASTRFASVPGLLSDDAICLLEPTADARHVAVRGYGPARALYRHLQKQVDEWSQTGRPFTHGLAVEAMPVGQQTAMLAASGATVV